MKVAVIAHAGKSFGDGLPALRRTLAAEGIQDPFWCEVSKSRDAPRQVRRALDDDADLVFVWGGDGMVQRCADVLAGSKASLAVLPAGAANLFATNLGIPTTIDEAVAVGLRGERRKLDLGRVDGERFAVMASIGFGAKMISGADRGLKRRLGKIAYVWTGSKAVQSKPFRAKIEVDGSPWYDGDATFVVVANVGRVVGGVEAFEDASPEDGLLELGVVKAEGVLQWGRTLARTALGNAGKSPFVRQTKAHRVKVKLSRKVLYELDGGARRRSRSFKAKVEPGAITVCVPAGELSLSQR